MDSLDIIIVMVALLVAARGVATGFARQLGSLGGFTLGLFLGAALASPISSLLPAGGGRAILALFVFFGVAITVAALGELAGDGLSEIIERYRMRPLDASLGAMAGVIIVLLVTWMLAAVFQSAGGSVWALEIQNSKILQALDASLPPAPDVVARLERQFNASSIPRVFAGLEPSPAPPVTGPDAAAVNAAAAAGRAATVKIEGFGCGGIVEGSGFVVGNGLVATNAHVVAGISHPTVIDANGPHRSEVVLFDPNMDFAVLRTSGLAAAPLTLDSGNADRGIVGAVLGYPGGGSFTVSSAAVLQRENALGRDIYDSSLTQRDIYVLQAIVRPGNSGGPLITPNGTVIGVVFAMSTTNPNVGYALTSAEIQPDLAQAQNSGPVSTEQCVSD
jgi:S1-C subfamily serine protease